MGFTDDSDNAVEEDLYDYSDDRCYRYRFDRRWGGPEDGGRIVWVGLNPGTGDTDHRRRPTMARMVAWTRLWNGTALTIVNLFAWRSTDPKALRTAADPIGCRNDVAIADAVEGAAQVILCWGGAGRLRGRGRSVAASLPGSLCLGTTARGEPLHPLYVPKSAKPVAYQLPDS
ncbi:MAG: hypothetical protein QOG44_2885 [Acidimicrobiaceae bacterium]|nr:hypothetical protein [Acidimicrobiaceae bacterium]